MPLTADEFDIFLLEDTVWCATAPVGVPIYDFHFDRFFVVRRPHERPRMLEAIGRFGAADDYSALYNELHNRGVRLVHDPEMQIRASELPSWYPLISQFTPRSIWFPGPPSADEIEAAFEWPVFIKGSRQTSKHQVELAIIPSREAYEQVVGKIRSDPVLH